MIPSGNSFLAGCGIPGEVACEGPRAVGVFWGEALGWPLVWDENEEIAVQSSNGGTKVAWGGPPVAPLKVPAASGSSCCPTTTPTPRSSG